MAFPPRPIPGVHLGITLGKHLVNMTTTPPNIGFSKYQERGETDVADGKIASGTLKRRCVFFEVSGIRPPGREVWDFPPGKCPGRGEVGRRSRTT